MQKYTANSIDVNDPKIVSTFDEAPIWSAPFGQRLLDSIELKKNQKVLDIGSGTGYPVLELAQRLGSSSVVKAIDPWQVALDRAEFKRVIFGISNLEFILGEAEKMPFRENVFDLIISNNGINNAEDMTQAISECHRVAKPGGLLIQTFNLPETMHEFYDVYKSVLEDNEMSEYIEKIDEHIKLRRKPVEYVTRIMRENGFLTDHIEIDSFTYEFLDAEAMFAHYFIRLAFLDTWTSIIPAEKVDDIFSKIKNKMAESPLKLTIPFALIKSRKI
jgi:arsenite methyltransferase